MFRRLALPALIALLALAALPAAASAGWFPAARQPAGRRAVAGHRAGRRRSTWRATAPAASSTSSGSTASRTSSSRASTAASSARPSASTTASAAARATRSIAAADADRLAIVWTSGSRVYGSVVAGNDRRPARCSARPSSSTTRRARPATRRSTWASTAPPTRPGRPRAAAAPTSAWRGCRTSRGRPIGVPIDVDPARAAGRGVQRSRVAVVGDGNALVAWGEDNADGRPRVWERRVTGADLLGLPAGALAARPRRRARRPRPTRSTSTWRTTAASAGPCSARTSAAARARSRGGCSA